MRCRPASQLLTRAGARAQEKPLALARAHGASGTTGMWESPLQLANSEAARHGRGGDSAAVAHRACPDPTRRRMRVAVQGLPWSTARFVGGCWVLPAPAGVLEDITRILAGYWGGPDVLQGAVLQGSIQLSVGEVGLRCLQLRPLLLLLWLLLQLLRGLLLLLLLVSFTLLWLLLLLFPGLR